MIRGIWSPPLGLEYADDFIDAGEEETLLEVLSSLALEPVTIRGNTAKRTVAHFALRYDYSSRNLRRITPIPRAFESVITRAESFAGLAKGSVDEALINRYPLGASIGWHSDADVYKTIIGLSLGATCSIQFRTHDTAERRVFQLRLAARSIYVMSGSAQALWQHRIPSTDGERYSLTLRSLKSAED